MDPAVSFGRVLRCLRKEAGLTQEQLAFAADVERNYISLMERGANQPAVRIIFRLAAALGVTPSEMLRLVEEELAQAVAEQEIKR